MRAEPKRETTRITVSVFLFILGGLAVLTWFLLPRYAAWIRAVSVLAAGVFFVVLYCFVEALRLRQTRKAIAERLCTEPFLRPPRWNDRDVEKYVLRGPAVKALMIEHNRIAREVESAVVGLGYRRKQTRKALAIARCEYGMHTYDTLFHFVANKLSGEYKNIYRIGAMTNQAPPEPPGQTTKSRAAGR